MNTSSTLLAKSPIRDPKASAAGRTLTLEQHLIETARAVDALFDGGARLGRQWLQMFRLEGEVSLQRLLANLRAAALLHDIGKANADFQHMMHRRLDCPQRLRHEHLSALILHLPEMRHWLSSAPELDVDIVTAAVLSHHIKADEGDGYAAWAGAPAMQKPLQLYLRDPQVRNVLDRVAQTFGLGAPPTLPADPWTPRSRLWAKARADGRTTSNRFGRFLRRDATRRGLLLAVKSGLIVADTVASALFRTGDDLHGWLNERLHLEPFSAAEIDAKIIDPRAATIVAKTGRPFQLQPFQLEVADAGPRALLLAGCGAGKTLAAWKWAQARAQTRTIGRVLFLYPTRGTATEGFRDYVSADPEGILLHGTADYELEAMMANPPEHARGRDWSALEAEARMRALRFWHYRSFSATVDQFLSFLEHRYDSLCLLPMLADSAVILDEVHSYDNHMFRNLLAFLENLDVPVLCMTATLTPTRLADLTTRGLEVHPRGAAPDGALETLRAAEAHPRYVIDPVGDYDEAVTSAVAAYRAGQRVLWVVNTVARCQENAAKLEAAIGQPVLTYHSRYRLMDRQRIHSEVVRAFQQEGAPAVAVTTQVCEMSLDLDADMLITEHAPIPAFVQRVGRANRHPERRPDFRATIHTYAPPTRLPYPADELEACVRFLSGMTGRSVSQRDLSAALLVHAPERPEEVAHASFIAGGYFAIPGSFRDIDDRGFTCVLDTDLDTVVPMLSARDEAGRWAPKLIDGFLLPLRSRRGLLSDHPRPTRLPRWIEIANGVCYDERRGFLLE